MKVKAKSFLIFTKLKSWKKDLWIAQLKFSRIRKLIYQTSVVVNSHKNVPQKFRKQSWDFTWGKYHKKAQTRKVRFDDKHPPSSFFHFGG